MIKHMQPPVPLADAFKAAITGNQAAPSNLAVATSATPTQSVAGYTALFFGIDITAITDLTLTLWQWDGNRWFACGDLTAVKYTTATSATVSGIVYVADCVTLVYLQCTPTGGGVYYRHLVPGFRS